MNPRERITKAVAHQQTDICPYELRFIDEVHQRLVEFTGDAHFNRELETHVMIVGSGYPNTGERVDERRYTDAYGVIWEESIAGEAGVVLDPVLKRTDLEGYQFPSAQLPGVFDDVPAQIAENSDKYLIWCLGFSLFERAWSLRGLEQFLVDMLEQPAFVDELLERICQFNLELLERACQYGIDCVRFGDDWGSQRGMIMGPQLWRRFIKPHFARMVQKVAAHGKATFLHSDGDIRQIIPDLIEVGLTILNPVQPDVMDIYALKREYGKDLTFWGGVSVQQLLPYGTSQQVRTQVRRLIRELGAAGGFVIAPTHSLGTDIPLENLIAMVEEFSQKKPAV